MNLSCLFQFFVVFYTRYMKKYLLTVTLAEQYVLRNKTALVLVSKR